MVSVARGEQLREVVIRSVGLVSMPRLDEVVCSLDQSDNRTVRTQVDRSTCLSDIPPRCAATSNHIPEQPRQPSSHRTADRAGMNEDQVLHSVPSHIASRGLNP